MKISEAQTEMRRWLDYLDLQEAQSVELQQLASARRAGSISAEEAKKKMEAMRPCSPTVYDGSRLAEAVSVALRALESQEEKAA